MDVDWRAGTGQEEVVCWGAAPQAPLTFSHSQPQRFYRTTNLFVQSYSLNLLAKKLRHQRAHRHLKRRISLLHILRPHIPPRREHVAVRRNLGQRGGLAEARHVGVHGSLFPAPRSLPLVPAPQMIRPGNAGDVGVGEDAVGAVAQCAQRAGGSRKWNLPIRVGEVCLTVVPVALARTSCR